MVKKIINCMHCDELYWTWFLDHWLEVKTVHYFMILMCTLHLQYLYDISSRRLGPALRLTLNVVIRIIE